MEPQPNLTKPITTPLTPLHGGENVENRLKPCPYCGNEPLLDRVFKQVSCPYCLIRTPWCESLEDAIERWNTRAEENPGESFYREQQDLAYEQMRREMDE